MGEVGTQESKLLRIANSAIVLSGISLGKIGVILMKTKNRINYEQVKEDWNTLAIETGLRTIIKLNDKRVKGVKNRLRDDDFDMNEIFEKIIETPFLLGKNDKGWQVDFDFVFLSDHNWVKIIEGKYDSRTNKSLGSIYAELTEKT